MGAAPCALYDGSPMYCVVPLSTKSFCTSTPLCSTVTRAADLSVPSALNVGAVQTTSYTFHSPGLRMALTSGALCLYMLPACPFTYFFLLYEPLPCSSCTPS